MFRKILLPFTLAMLVLVIAIGPVQAGKSYFAQRYDVDVAVQADGALVVTETIVFRFDGGPFTYVFRDLNYTNLDEIDRLQAQMDGVAIAQGTQAGQVEIEAGHPLKVTWHFAPTSDATHTFTLIYRVQGALQKESAADTLIWRAIPEEHDYTIAQSTIRLIHPAGVAPLSAPVLAGAGAQAETSATMAAFNVQNIDKDVAVDVSVHYPAGSLAKQVSTWQANQERRSGQTAASLPFGLGAAGLVGLAGLAIVVRLATGFRRESTPGLPTRQPTPPRPLAPALAARLAGGANPALGTFFDLARRGHVQVVEGARRWGSRQYEVLRQAGSDALLPHEEEFLDTLFRGSGVRVPMSKLATAASSASFLRALDEELGDAHLLDVERAALRTRMMALGVATLMTGTAMAVVGTVLLGNALGRQAGSTQFAAVLAGAGAGLFVTGMISLVYAATQSTQNEEGQRQAAAWRNFSTYLRDVTRGREGNPFPDWFEKYLPYAAAFGLATEWARTFEKLNDMPIPEWFQGLQGGLEDGSFTTMMAAVNSADSSSYSSGGADGGGASGGGASGAG